MVEHFIEVSQEEIFYIYKSLLFISLFLSDVGWKKGLIFMKSFMVLTNNHFCFYL